MTTGACLLTTAGSPVVSGNGVTPFAGFDAPNIRLNRPGLGAGSGIGASKDGSVGFAGAAVCGVVTMGVSGETFTI